MNKLMKKKKKGFTLIELIAVIAILAILAVVAVPRVIQYVDKSKKTAIQAEATTIYNAAEAAYNDGKLKPKDGESLVSTATKFDSVKLKDAVDALESQDLLSGKTNVDKFNGKVNTLGQLKNIINAKTDSITVNSDGNLDSLPTSSETPGA